LIDKENAHTAKESLWLMLEKDFMKDGNKVSRDQDIHKIVDVFLTSNSKSLNTAEW
jgi:hypothetical protein